MSEPAFIAWARSYDMPVTIPGAASGSFRFSSAMRPGASTSNIPLHALRTSATVRTSDPRIAECVVIIVGLLILEAHFEGDHERPGLRDLVVIPAAEGPVEVGQVRLVGDVLHLGIPTVVIAPRHEVARSEGDGRVLRVDQPRRELVRQRHVPVSYTHLRAHETPEHLV